jgi:RHS repeat-associated protein
VTDAENHSATILFDQNFRVVAAFDPLEHPSGANFDVDGNVSAVATLGGGVSTFVFDKTTNQLTITDAMNTVETMAFGDNFYPLQSITDGNFNVTSFGYDANGNPATTAYPDGTTETVVYDANGTVKRTIDRANQTTTYTYYPSGLLKSISLPDGTHTDYTYDAHGNLASATDAHGAIILNYDAADRLTRVTYPNGRYLIYNYDSAGRHTQTIDQSGFTTNYSFDLAGRLSDVKDGNNNLISHYAYDYLSRVSEKDDGNGTYTTYAYDPAGRVTELINYRPDNTINSQFDYTYDDLGRMYTMTTLDGITTYSYDGVSSRLSSVTLSDNTTITYSYDAAGNRTSSFDGTTFNGYTINELNQVRLVGGTAYDYDLDGNLKSRSGDAGNASYAYDGMGHLIQLINADGTWTFEYDALGSRTAVTHNGQRTEYLVDPTGPGSVVGEYNGSGQLLAHYSYGLGLTSRADSSSQRSYFDFDATGSTVGLSASNGAYANTYSYLPFGEILSRSESIRNPFQFDGAMGIQNDGSGLNFMRARYYDPSLGRFTQPDPIDIAGGLNLYTFALNDPLTAADPSGLLPISPLATTLSLINPLAVTMSGGISPLATTLAGGTSPLATTLTGQGISPMATTLSAESLGNTMLASVSDAAANPLAYEARAVNLFTARIGGSATEFGLSEAQFQAALQQAETIIARRAAGAALARGGLYGILAAEIAVIGYSLGQLGMAYLTYGTPSNAAGQIPDCDPSLPAALNFITICDDTPISGPEDIVTVALEDAFEPSVTV